MSDPTIKVHDKSFELFLPEADIAKRVTELAKDLKVAYASKQLIMIGILNGAYPFLTDLSNQMEIEIQISFMKVSSYDGLRAGGKVNELLSLNTEIQGRHVLIVEDIVDTGNTLAYIRDKLAIQKPESLKVVTCFLKPGIFKQSYTIDWSGFEIPNDFVVGYGMDYNGLGRNLRSVYKLK